MRKLITILAVVSFTACVWAQSPQKISYQAMIRNAGNNLVISQSIGMRVSILQGSAAGIEVYKETYNPIPLTNTNGLVTIEIGSGIPVTGIFANINWANGPYFIKTETDPGGGTNYTITGTSQLLSVPYAFYSASGGTMTGVTASPPLSSSGGTAPDIFLSGTVPVANLPSLAGDATGTINAITVVKLQNRTLAPTVPTNGQVLTYNLGNSQWEPQNLSNSTGWSLTGNTGTIAGTNFIGTTDAHQLMFKVNNQKAGYIDYALPFNAGFGYQTLNSITTGIDNTALGNYALNANTEGSNNTANGYAALYLNTKGNQNTAIGQNALYYNTEGSDNTATGFSALVSNVTGYSNTANGIQTLFSNTTGGNNAAYGMKSLYSNSTGNSNTAIGNYALYSNAAGRFATALGNSAMYYANNTPTSFTNYNVAVGFEALRGSPTPANNTGNYNTTTGYQTLRNNSTGSQNSGNGYNALYSNTEGNFNTANGVSALMWNTTGNYNTAYGVNALFYNSIGQQNTACGVSSLVSNVAGSNGTAIGYNAMYYANNTLTPFTNCNVAIGFEALRGSSTASANTGNNNTATGYESLWNNTKGNYNTANGVSALLNNNVGSSNTAIGVNALFYNLTGGNNTAMGGNAGLNNTIGNNNTYIGNNANGALNLNFASAIGSNAYVSASNTMVLGDPNDNLFSVCIGRNHSASGYKLSVSGKIICEELKVQLAASWPDYVFDEKYQLMPIDELAQNIEQQKHLPGLPSAAEVKQDGISVGDMQAKLLEKVEQLTLYVIQLQKQNDELTKKDAEIMQLINKSIDGNY
jgi:hypothetical protein